MSGTRANQLKEKAVGPPTFSLILIYTAQVQTQTSIERYGTVLRKKLRWWHSLGTCGIVLFSVMAEQ